MTISVTIFTFLEDVLGIAGCEAGCKIVAAEFSEEDSEKGLSVDAES